MLGIAALVAAAAGLILASEAASAVLVGTIAVLWLLATVRHFMVPTAVTVHERDLHEALRH